MRAGARHVAHCLAVLSVLATAASPLSSVLLRARRPLAVAGICSLRAQETSDQQARVASSMDAAIEKSKKGLVDSPSSTGLALQLDDGTRKSHSMAENTAFVTGFFRGIATTESFAELVSTLYFVYQAMEKAFDEASDERVLAMDSKPLRRLAALEVDMEYYFGTNFRATAKPSAAARKYVARVEEVANNSPHLLVAHMYTRYLGDLFGGQMMGGMARRSLGLAAGRGTAFYDFGGIPDTKAFISEWYGSLNALDLTAAQKQDVVDEGNLVFALNIEVFEELGGNPVQAVWKLVTSQFREALGLK